MKVLFIGEGRHDIGDARPNPNDPRPAEGVIPTLARRICEDIDPDSIALAWTEVRRFHRSAEKSGYAAKISAAALLAERRFGCTTIVAVADRDGKDDRKSALEEGTDRARQLFPRNPIVWGLAIESVEAWTLGVPDKIAEELGVDVKLVQQQYPQGVHVESLSNQSGKPDHRPKQLLERIAQLRHRQDCTEFRQSVAERTDIDALSGACPKGFALFAEQLRKAFA